MHRRVLRGILAAVLVGAGLSVVAGGAPGAGEFTVTSGDDAGPGTLRQAFIDANATDDDDTITVDPSVGTINLTSSSLDYLDPFTVTVLGNGVEIVVADGSLAGLSVFRATGGVLRLEDLTVRGNNTSAAGGGVVSTSGDVDLHRVVLEDNHTSGGSGGAIEAVGDVLVTDSTIRGNSTDIDGGGFSVGGTLTLERTTVSGNEAPNTGSFGRGGGIDAEIVVTTNSTITGNTAGNAGGGIFAVDAFLTYSTVASNTAPTGANITIDGLDTLDTTTSAIADPLGGGANCFFTAEPSVVSGGYNFDSDESCFLDSPTDINGGDALLGPLGDNGGPTQTRLPAGDSPLVDAIPFEACPADGVTTDQRLEPRPGVDSPELCDIGAVELQGIVPVPPAPIVLEPTFTG